MSESHQRKIIPISVGTDDKGRRAGDAPPDVRDALEILKEACGPNFVTAIFFGSRLLGTSPTEDSAADLFVVVEDYEEFYRGIGARLPARRRASIMAALNRMLPPNIIYVRDPADLAAGTKCFVISRRDIARDLSRRARDHFCRGRLTQRVQVVYARTPEDGEQIERRLDDARRRSMEWVPLYLPATFSVKEYCIRMLEVSFAGEIRPENRARFWEVFEAQQAYLRLTYGRVLEDAVAGGRLTRTGNRYRLTRRPTIVKRLRWKLFFQKSKMRATLRWGKYMLTFDDWLDYIARKAERRSGVSVELTQAERRLPALLLWPKVFRVLRALRETPASRAPGASSDTLKKDDRE